MRTLVLTLWAILAFWLSSYAATITIDKSTQYQTIEGLGAGVHWFDTWKQKDGPFYRDVDLDAHGFYDTIIHDLGLTLIRFLEDGNFEVDSGAYVTTDYMARQLLHTRKFLAACQRQNEPMMVMTSVLSPPAYMKLSGETAGSIEAAPDYNVTDCRLKDGYDDVYARFVVEYLQRSRDSLGVEQYAFSIQNEPAFQEPYASCVYNDQRYTQTLKVVGREVRSAGLTTRFFGAEHMAWAFPNRFENYLRQDAEALGFIHAWAVHGYSDGNSADTGSYTGATTTDKGLWMSETSGYGTHVHDWARAMTLGGNMLSFLRDGRISAWNYLHIMENSTSGEMDIPGSSCLYVDGQRTAKFYIAHHFYRYIRPGARQIGSTTNDGGLEVVAFWHEDNQCMSIVLRNPGTAKTVTTISGADLPAQFTVLASSASDKLVQSTASPTDAIAIPANSIVTLVAGTYLGSGSSSTFSSARPARSAPSQSTARRTPEVFSIAGRRIARNRLLHGMSQGVYLSSDGVTAKRGVRLR